LDAISQYHRLLAADPAAAREQADALREAFRRERVTFGGEPMATLLRPALLARAEWDALRGSAAQVARIAERVARQAFGGDVRRLCAFLGTSDAEAVWIELDPGPPDFLFTRLDALQTPAGPRFIEINSDAPAGLGYGDRMARLFRELPVVRAFEREVPLAYQGCEEALVRGLAARWRASGGTGRPRIAIADWAESQTRADEEILREALAARGFECVVADPRAMEIHRGRLHAGGAPVDLVYRRAVLSELVGREIEVQAFMGAYRHRLCPFVNSFRSRISEDKVFLAILSDEAFAQLLSPEERELLGRVLPWTRRLEERRTRKAGVEIDLLPYALANRESLVLKPAHEYGGREVIVGSEASWPEWDAALRGALGGPWVVQERITPPAEPFPLCDGGELRIVPLHVNQGPFCIAGEPAGAVARASEKPVVSVSVGGASVPTFVFG